MPFFTRKSEKDSQAKQERKMCLAKDNPEPIFDLSHCDLTEVPSGVYSMCRVFRKESLCLHNNLLSSLNGGGNLHDLSNLRVLDLHGNKFTKIPDRIAYLINLEILNLAENKLTCLPSTLSTITKLNSLDIKANDFQEIPQVICDLKRLQILDISKNEKLTQLPQNLCLLSTTLETIHLDISNICYPPSEICQRGTQEIMKFLCKEYGCDYTPISTPSESEHQKLSAIQDDDLPPAFHRYLAEKKQRQKSLLQWEEDFKEGQYSQSQKVAEAQVRRLQLLEEITQDQEKIQEELEQVHNLKDQEKKKMLIFIKSLGEHSTQLIKNLIENSERSKSTLKEAIEKDREEAEKLFLIKQEEMVQLRKKEVLDDMNDLLISQNNSPDYKKISELKEELMTQLIQEEEVQRKAFEALQLKKDQAHIYIASQIKLIEEELMKLTRAELKEKDIKLDTDFNTLAEQRTALAELLSQLLERKCEREKELLHRIKQMEEHKESEAADFWLMQYQRLMDKKPFKIASMEESLDPLVKEILMASNASQYLTLFAMKSINFFKLSMFDFKNLKQIGVFDEEICHAIYNLTQENVKSQNKEKFGREEVEPSAPFEDQPSAPMFSPVQENIWLQAECVVCLDRLSYLVFIPCGHCCCCQECGNCLKSCPMCREQIHSSTTLN